MLLKIISQHLFLIHDYNVFSNNLRKLVEDDSLRLKMVVATAMYQNYLVIIDL